MGCPYHICHRPYGNAIEETQDRDILFPVFFHFFQSLPARLEALCLSP